ncbi:MAG: hypothetical protein K2L80_09020 [Muribaculaceae bacterium]|nr:hypothetical protein [Muribaculaceae bacterium]
MGESSFKEASFDSKNPFSIYDYSRFLVGHSLHSLLGEAAVECKRKGKGGLGQMVEELFFNYRVNSNRDADFQEAKVELKCTPLLKSKSDDSFRIKERLVCTMIDYFELADTKFEDSHLLAKCQLMLLLFYHHVSGTPIYDYEFLFRILWQIPEKDLILIKNDYETIVNRVRKGEAHLISEGDTIYLGACRKGQKGDAPQSQPFSTIKANKRAFSLKPAYMRYILKHVIDSGNNYFTNYQTADKSDYELVSTFELRNSSFENIIINRFSRFYGLNFLEICSELGISQYQAKNKYADIAGLIASNSKSKRISEADEFVKSGIMMKTIRLRRNGMPKEAMSFKNIDYQEVFENDNWLESEAYEIFTNRFLFVIFKPEQGKTITVRNNKTGQDVIEQSYVLDRVFFWTMSPDDLDLAKKFWEHIRENVTANKIELQYFWNISDKKDFHVRPKASKKVQLTSNPHGGEVEKYSYWLNASFVKRIIDKNTNV